MPPLNGDPPWYHALRRPTVRTVDVAGPTYLEPYMDMIVPTPADRHTQLNYNGVLVFPGGPPEQVPILQATQRRHNVQEIGISAEDFRRALQSFTSTMSEIQAIMTRTGVSVEEATEALLRFQAENEKAPASESKPVVPQRDLADILKDDLE